jgi:type II secretory pathway component PulF
LRQRIRFYQQMDVLVRAGVPIRASLVRLKERIAGNEVAVLSEKVNAGERIGEAFAAAGFSPFECHLVTAGERSAQLDTVFQHLSEFWTRELKMREALVRPLYYPLVVLHLAVLVGAVVELATTSTPWPVVLIHLLEQMALLYVIGFIVYIVVRVSWSSPVLRRFWLRVPIIGNALRTTYAYRWITVLKLEFSAGVSLYRAVGDAWRASGYVECERLAEEGEQAMREGADLSKMVLQWKQLPRDWIDFIATAEISGAFEAVFKNLEKEAAYAWSMAQERMTEWVPKILYFICILALAVMVLLMAYRVEIAPIVNVEKQIDDANGGK